MTNTGSADTGGRETVGPADALHRTSALAILSQLTLDEKISLLDGSDFWNTQGIPRVGLPSIMVTDGPHGLRKQTADADHLGLNGSLPATCFPSAAGIASSWDTTLMRRVGEALGDECRAADVAVLLGPGVNMKRSPLCGRNFEYFSEDPLIAGTLAAAFTAGVQSKGVGVSLKHFAANNQETERMTVSVDVDERTLREIYFPAFETVVREATPWTVMCSYNRINGTYVSEDHRLLTSVLRDEWGFAGLVISDWGAVNDRDRAVAAGLDLEMPASGGSGATRVNDAITAGTLSESDVDSAVLNVLTLVARSQDREPLEAFDVGAHHELAREAAQASAVLLKNDGGILPLSNQGGPIAVIGEFARTPRYQGAGSSLVNPTSVDNALDGIRGVLDGGREVLFAPGYEIESEGSDAALIDAAVAASSNAAVAVVFLGLPPSYESEGYDREHMELPANQLAVLHAVAEANTNVVVVLSNGSAVTVSGWQHLSKAVLEGWLMGQAGGSATAELLFGLVSPSGKLAETIPERHLDTPTIGNFPGERGVVRYGEGLLIGYRWYDTRDLSVSYPFGHGLTYTTFGYSGLSVAVDSDGPEPRVVVRLTVTNTGEREGSEIVQVYVTDPEATVERPAQELRGFARLTLAPGESSPVEIDLTARAFAFWDVAHQGWTIEGGEFGVLVGASSRDIRLSTTIQLTGTDSLPTLSKESSVDEFFAHSQGRQWLEERLSGTGFGDMLLDEQHGRMLRAIPLVRLSRFPGAAFSEAELDEAIAGFEA
ncbi:glycoside hydrolase family 3 C-terminal domain-containing protein [Subtercola frigoramans]|uniref:Beta-glucosidase n=1 Tax=Subtercola frigoramans TaxID=120298 RepID=A0ABS2L9F5_9MICO|nr:glycoside hydrolase family 3 C-terminal domain-containing protein [Subtercola frigoramans]MBM7473707.1 beta-glucosidase [Subtercola frigoramans]